MTADSPVFTMSWAFVAASGRALRRSTEVTVPNDKPRNLSCCLPVRWGALMLGASFGSAQQFPSRATIARSRAGSACGSRQRTAGASGRETDHHADPATSLHRPGDWGANESTAAKFAALGRDRWLERQLHPGRRMTAGGGPCHHQWPADRDPSVTRDRLDRSRRNSATPTRS